jgi:hypothetical protein
VSGPAGLEPLAAPGRLGPLSRLALSAEILGVYARVRRELRRTDIRAAIARLRAPALARPPSAASGALGYASGVRLGKAAASVLGPLPVESGCLQLSLVLCSLLARRGVQSSIVIGVRPGDDFGAHAWVELDGRPLLPSSEAEFERLVEL